MRRRMALESLGKKLVPDRQPRLRERREHRAGGGRILSGRPGEFI